MQQKYMICVKTDEIYNEIHLDFNKFHKNWFRHSKVDKGDKQTHGKDGK
jgi:hypothetical protein